MQIAVKVPYLLVWYRIQATLMEHVRCYYSRSVSCAVRYPDLPSIAEFGVLKASGSITARI